MQSAEGGVAVAVQASVQGARSRQFSRPTTFHCAPLHRVGSPVTASHSVDEPALRVPIDSHSKTVSAHAPAHCCPRRAPREAVFRIVAHMRPTGKEGRGPASACVSWPTFTRSGSRLASLSAGAFLKTKPTLSHLLGLHHLHQARAWPTACAGSRRRGIQPSITRKGVR